MTYLHDCLRQFAEVSKKQWKRPFNLEALEAEVEDLRNSKKLSIAKLQCFKNTEHWWFDKYWRLPSAADLPPDVEEVFFDFHQLSKGNEGKPKEQRVIEDLLQAFLSIELVSIILRFIRPDSFGILSPPVEHVLDLRRGRDAVQTYLNYLRNLRSIRDKYKFDTAAKADMALWVLAQKCYGIGTTGDPKIRQEYEKDRFMLRLRAENLVKPLGNLSPAWLATALHTVDDHLAALVGCWALEKSIKEWAKIEGVERKAVNLAKKANEKLNLRHYIEALPDKGKFFSVDRGMLHHLREIRNKVFHAEVREPTPKYVSELVETVLEIEQGLSNRGKLGKV